MTLFASSVTYDCASRVAIQPYPPGFAVTDGYSA